MKKINRRRRCFSVRSSCHWLIRKYCGQVVLGPDCLEENRAFSAESDFKGSRGPLFTIKLSAGCCPVARAPLTRQESQNWRSVGTIVARANSKTLVQPL